MNIEKRLLEGDKRACARMITMLENNDEEAIEIIKKLYKHTGGAYVIGITGPPGSGKSTLTDRLTKELRKMDKKVGIIAIDPTSPFTGGAILGDRIRMNDLALDKDVFIRSMGTRGSLGGMSKATWGAIKVLDIYGCDYILVETVGVGQSEVDIVKTADTVLMVMVPNLGDDIQALKAGIMEIADVFAINKSDLDGADRTKVEIEMNLDLNSKEDYRPPVVKVSAGKNKNIDKLLDELIKHRNYLEETNELLVRRKENTKIEILKLVEEELMDLIMHKSLEKNVLENLSEEVVHKNLDPYSAKDKVLNIIKE
ncbi:MAG: methylmalonyl Co-A mutase-associated GTPase MeaB [Tissierellia bacterium]|nr:methylmalonyl Co-A mutase-associated GTPase MeaB [Tissierellia bacterium]